MKKALCLLSSLFAAYSASCFPASTITLTGGEISPASSYYAPLNKLVDGVGYKVKCDVIDANYAMNPVVLSISARNPTLDVKIIVGGKLLGDSHVQIPLTGVSNTIEFAVVYHATKDAKNPENSITLTNSDLIDTLVVKDCIATPAKFY